MKNIEKSHVDDAPDSSSSSSLNHLPDEIIFQILSKVVDLKTLCFCYLVSRRFSLIVLQVDTISFTAPLSDTDNNITGFRKLSSLINGVVFKPLHLLQHSSKRTPPITSYFLGKSFRTAVSFSALFTTLKSFTIELPTPSHKCIDNTRLFKWKITFSNEIESFLLLSPNSICDAKDDQHIVEEEESMELTLELYKTNYNTAVLCVQDVIVRHKMLLYLIKHLPNLEKLSITDSGNRGKLSMSGENLAKARECIHLGSDNVKTHCADVSQYYIPVLNLPVSGCVMKGVILFVMRLNAGTGCFMNDEEGFEGKLGAVYSEAVTEILENHGDKMASLMLYHLETGNNLLL